MTKSTLKNKKTRQYVTRLEMYGLITYLLINALLPDILILTP